MKPILTCFLLLLGSLAFSQQKNVLEITVINIETKKPVPNTQVLYATGEELGTTDQAGKLKIYKPSNGTKYFILFSYEYGILEQKVLVTDSTAQITFEMTPLGEVLTEVEIDQHKKEIFNLKRLRPVEGTAIYAGKKTEVVLVDQVIGGQAINNARQVMAQVVGLNIFEAGDGGLSLSIGGRGLDPNRTANFNTRQNGYDISADVLGYPESYYTPPVEALQEIQVIRGAASLQYGTQFGGLINFKLKEPVKNKEITLKSRNTVGSFGLYTNFTSISGTKGKFSYYAAYNYKRGDGYRENANFDSDNIFAQIAYQFTPDTKLSFEMTYMDYLARQSGGLSDVQFLENPRQSFRTRNWFAVNWNLYNMKFEHKFSSKTDFSMNVFGLKANRKALGFLANNNKTEPNPLRDIDEQNPDGTFVHNRDLLVGEFNNWGAEARLLTHYDIKDRSAVFLIGSKIYQANNTSQQGPGSKGTDPDFNFYTGQFPTYPNQSDFQYPNFNLALFGENIFNITDYFSVTPGFRFEYIKTTSEGQYLDVNIEKFVPDNRTFERNIFLLGIGLSYKPDNYFELYGNLSQNYRSVTFSDIRTTSPSFTVSPDIHDEKGFTSDVGVRGKIGSVLSYDASVFGLLYQGKLGTYFADRIGWLRDNIGDALIYGAESMFDLNMKQVLWNDSSYYRASVFLNTAFTNSTYLSSDYPGVVGNKVEFVPLVNMKTGVKFGYKNFLSSLQYTFLSEQFTDVTNAPYDPFNDSSVKGAIPAYDVMDLSLSYSITRFRFETGITNLLDRSYFTRRATGYPGPGIIASDGRGYYFTFEFNL